MLPIENFREYFEGDPRQLLAWFADMPALRPWWADGRRGAWTVKLLRIGGLRAIPYLVEDGLAIGGAAAGLGVDFPALNLTGPATATGLLLSQAAVRIRAEGGDFDRANSSVAIWNHCNRRATGRTWSLRSAGRVTSRKRTSCSIGS